MESEGIHIKTFSRTHDLLDCRVQLFLASSYVDYVGALELTQSVSWRKNVECQSKSWLLICVMSYVIRSFAQSSFHARASFTTTLGVGAALVLIPTNSWDLSQDELRSDTPSPLLEMGVGGTWCFGWNQPSSPTPHRQDCCWAHCFASRSKPTKLPSTRDGIKTSQYFLHDTILWSSLWLRDWEDSPWPHTDQAFPPKLWRELALQGMWFWCAFPW